MIHKLKALFFPSQDNIHDALKQKTEKQVRMAEEKPIIHEEAPGETVQTESTPHVVVDNKPLAAPFGIREAAKPAHPFERRNNAKRRALTEEEVKQLQAARKNMQELKNLPDKNAE